MGPRCDVTLVSAAVASAKEEMCALNKATAC